jgi:ADP-ribose pyrophosphatase YjhB (NUDIX family)
MPTEPAVTSEATRRSRRLQARIKLFHMLFLLRRPMTLGARAVVYDMEENAVLLVRHTYMPGWQLPGGGVEPGETMEEALRRELREEGNVELTGPPELRSIHFNRQASRRDHVALYLVREFQQTAEYEGNREIAEARFFPLDALPEGTTAATRRRIAEVFEGEGAAEEW